MREKIDCFLPDIDRQLMAPTVAQLEASKVVRDIFWTAGMTSSQAVMQIAEQARAEYTLLFTKPAPVTIGKGALERMLRVACDSGAAMVYADRSGHPAIDYQLGSVRDDFDFGSLLLIRTSLLHTFALQDGEPDYQYAGLYALRLFLSRQGQLLHLNEVLYSEVELDNRASGVKQFDYVNPRNRDVQIEMEHAATAHLEAIGARIDPSNAHTVDFNEQEFPVEATVVIPVFNRAKTIADAVNSALEQQTTFPFNVIVVDNHSTDGTSDILSALASSRMLSPSDSQLHVIVPERTDLGIGGCWNEAINDVRCGRFAVQLDSDDLYSSPNTLQQVVDTFRKQKAAMVIGSYRMCDFELSTLPPGLIDHREWTDENGPNNALRINGLGAPRAFFTPVLRQIQFPNTSYGEDYALGLAFSRHYRIGRIYDELYLCRRWGGNSDAALSVEKVNANNLYKDRLRTLEIRARQQMNSSHSDQLDESPLQRFFDLQLDRWDDARRRYRELRRVETRELPIGASTIVAQWNPARIVSTGAKMDSKTLGERPCFLCGENRPKEQMKRIVDGKWELLVNPYPILPMHFTIPSLKHRPQAIKDMIGEMYRLLTDFPDLLVFYNGPKCGASAPDHSHLQAGTSGIVPLQKSWQRLSRDLTPVVRLSDDADISIIADYPCPALLIRSTTKDAGDRLFRHLYAALPQREDETEPMMNILGWRHDGEYLLVVIPRDKHRPDCYTAEGDDQFIVSPGALDMAGLMITPREEDFRRLTPELAINIMREVALSEATFSDVVQRMKDTPLTKVRSRQEPQFFGRKEPQVSVGIVSGQQIVFTLNAPYTAKGAAITGDQVVEFSEGAILWHGQQYRELLFTPQQQDASFSLRDVTIGVNFHWERKQTQTFNGSLRLVVESDQITAINELPVERYLTSVISSEMAATSSLELLKAHAVISRSWLLAQIEKRRRMSEGSTDNFFSFTKKDDELIRWYDREDHTIFDVCADDHCQRYQGITNADNPSVVEAIRQTRGQILTYDGEICDARFSKCCGGRTEEFQYCWEDTPKPYLVSVDDPWCNTHDRHILQQVLNDYDQETPDFYTWTVSYSRKELTELVSRKLKLDLGDIVDLVPLERGKSGRIWKLQIVGTKRSFTIGKELEIRRTLSETHLYSSAFDVEKRIEEKGKRKETSFILNGHGWGHGVGLCQIGAAVMGEQGKPYDEILLFYYRNAEIHRLYD
jgi:SpoIID/LytB domain protein